MLATMQTIEWAWSGGQKWWGLGQAQKNLLRNEIEYAQTLVIIPAIIDFDPDTLNKASKSGENSVTVYIELPKSYDVADIDVSTVKLSTERGTVSAQLTPTEVGDYDNDGILDRMVKFDRQAVIEIVNAGDQVKITVRGEVAEKQFEGSDTIRVVDKGKRK